MIISASYKTDIPTFYGEWFLNRLNAGFCKMINPYNRRATRVSLERHDVDGFIFWTKNLGPFLEKLKVVHDRNYPFVIQYTINNYPRTLEFSVVDARRSAEHMKLIANEYGPRVAIWRYDPIVVSSETPVDFQRRNFAELARSLEGSTDEVVVSFAQLYKKTKQNMNWASKKFGFSWEDPSDDLKLELTAEFAEIAKSHAMQLTICSQDAYLTPGVKAARCVDALRLGDVAGHRITAELKGNRPECGCFLSRDIGEYDTCPHGCVYCYAVRSRSLAQKRYKAHDPTGEFLFVPEGGASNEASEGETVLETPQMRML